MCACLCVTSSLPFNSPYLFTPPPPSLPQRKWSERKSLTPTRTKTARSVAACGPPLPPFLTLPFPFLPFAFFCSLCLALFSPFLPPSLPTNQPPSCGRVQLAKMERLRRVMSESAAAALEFHHASITVAEARASLARLIPDTPPHLTTQPSYDKGPERR